MDTVSETVNRTDLEAKVKEVYRAVAEHPEGRYHFRMGRGLASELGYPDELLERIPAGALESFAGVGYFFGLAALQQGEKVLDLGSGSGTDVFAAAAAVGTGGQVVGVDMTAEQLDKAERLRREAGITQASFIHGYIEDLPFPDDTFDCVISNGVVNLSADKPAVFREAARVLRPGGRLALADIVTERPLTPQIVCNADLWAACVGGAAQADAYRSVMAASGFILKRQERNSYGFLSGRARSATTTYGVMSLSFLAQLKD